MQICLFLYEMCNTNDFYIFLQMFFFILVFICFWYKNNFLKKILKKKNNFTFLIFLEVFYKNFPTMDMMEQVIDPAKAYMKDAMRWVFIYV